MKRYLQPISRTLWRHFKARKATFSPLIIAPKPNNVSFVTPSYMRMLFVANKGDCTFSYGGYSGQTFTVKDGHGYIINNVPYKIELSAPTNGSIYIPNGSLSSEWLLIAGDGNADVYSINIDRNANLNFTSSENATSTLDLEEQDLVETSETSGTVFSINDRDLEVK